MDNGLSYFAGLLMLCGLVAGWIAYGDEKRKRIACEKDLEKAWKDNAKILRELQHNPLNSDLLQQSPMNNKRNGSKENKKE